MNFFTCSSTFLVLTTFFYNNKLNIFLFCITLHNEAQQHLMRVFVVVMMMKMKKEPFFSLLFYFFPKMKKKNFMLILYFLFFNIIYCSYETMKTINREREKVAIHAHSTRNCCKETFQISSSSSSFLRILL